MNGLISRLITRHTEPGPVVSPRLPTKFEPLHAWPISPWHSQTEEATYANEENINLATEPAKPLQPGSVMENGERNDHQARPSFEADTKIHHPIKHPGTNAKEKTLDSHNTTVPVEKKHFLMETPFSFTGNHNETLAEVISTNEKQVSTSPLAQLGSDQHSQKNTSTSKKSSLLISESIKPVINEDRPHNETIINAGNDIYPVSVFNITSKQNEKHVSQPPVIKVSIGRIEVRAITPPAKTNRSTPQEPKLTLEAYLKQRSSEK